MNSVKRLKAEKRVKNISKYYKHIVLYILVNVALTVISLIYTFTFLMSKNFRITNEFANFDDGIYPIWAIWGIILLADTVRVFVVPKFLNKDWEERKIKEFLNS